LFATEKLIIRAFSGRPGSQNPDPKGIDLQFLAAASAASVFLIPNEERMEADAEGLAALWLRPR
jgi:hypothetical protein